MVVRRVRARPVAVLAAESAVRDALDAAAGPAAHCAAPAAAARAAAAHGRGAGHARAAGRRAGVGVGATMTFLSPAELVELTGLRRPSAQIAWLREHRWRYATNAVGHPRARWYNL
jgi:hypothetical protein